MFEEEKQNSNLNNKVVQNNLEDIFEETDSDSANNVVKPGGMAPAQPIKNYNELVKELDKGSNKINFKYFFIGFFVLLILGAGLFYIFYKEIFIKTSDTGEVILDTNPNSLELKNEKKINKNIKEIEGLKINSTSKSNDLDGDGLSNEEEKILKTDPEKVDTDGDGLSDRQEVKVYKTDPLDEDTDDDSFLDGQEIEAGYNPRGEGKLFNIDLVKNDSNSKDLGEPTNKDDDWLEYSKEDFYFQYPVDWIVKDEKNALLISKIEGNNYLEIDIRDNKLELDLIDWITTQEDYPDFQQEQIKVSDKDALLVKSEDPDWKYFSSIILADLNKVYIFNYFTSTGEDLDLFKNIVLSFKL